MKEGLISRKVKYIILIIIWGAFIGANGYYYLHHYMKTIQNRMHAENYYIFDSVWTPEYSKWHDDTMLYTLFKDKTVYINPNSWYATYVRAFADNVILDESIDDIVDMETADYDAYTRMNHMLLTSHTTLFDEDVREILVSGQEGLSLFVEEDSVYLSDSIILLNDKDGNIYLRGAENEK